MTDVDQQPHAAHLGDPHPVIAEPHVRHRRHTRWWWVLASVTLGALIGGSLALLVGDPSSPTSTKDITPTTTAADPKPVSIPSGLVAGGTSPARPAAHEIDNRVFVVGDSVMQGAAPYLADQLASWSIIADTRVGRFLPEANKVIEKRRKDIGQIAVLNLGNNYNGDEDQFAIDVNTALTELDGVAHVIWINVGEFEDDRTEVNDVLRQAAATHSNMTVVDWNKWWADNRSFTSGDHLHLTGEGAEAYAALVASAVKQVTTAAGELPAPGVKPPKLNTSGRIPASSSGSSGSGSGSSGSSSSGSSGTRRRTTTTVPVTPTVIQVPDTSPATSPATTAPSVTATPTTIPSPVTTAPHP